MNYIQHDKDTQQHDDYQEHYANQRKSTTKDYTMNTSIYTQFWKSPNYSDKADQWLLGDGVGGRN